jgi:hypothetical protein
MKIKLYKYQEGHDNIIRNIYSPRNAVVISPLKPNLIRVSADVQAVGYDFRFLSSYSFEINYAYLNFLKI